VTHHGRKFLIHFDKDHPPLFPSAQLGLIQVCVFFRALCLYGPTANLYLGVEIRVLSYVDVKTFYFWKSVKQEITLYMIVQYNCYRIRKLECDKYLLIVLLVVKKHLGSLEGKENLLGHGRRTDFL
jgi:hypothetical protein